MHIRRTIPGEAAGLARWISRPASLAASVLLAACISAPPRERTEYGQPPTASQAAKDPELVEAVHDAKISAPVGQPLGDAEIIQVVTTLDSGEIEQAELGRKKATDRHVAAYAEQLFEEHSRAKARAEQLAESLGSTLAQSSLASDLAGTRHQTLQMLEAADSVAFDPLYIRDQIQQHEEVLDLLDNHLIPRADDQSLKLHLQNSRALVNSHLSKAKELQRLVGRGPS